MRNEKKTLTLQQIFIKSNILKTIIRIILFFLLVQTASAESPKHEIRAVWLTTIQGLDWPHSHSTSQQKQELISILDQLQRANINTILFQTRVRATTVFPHDSEPWDACLTGQTGRSPGYDALQFCIDECHKRGMECHAWIVTIPVGKWNTDGCKLMRQRFPKLIVKSGEEGYMNPEMPQTGDYIARFCREVTRRYDIDGIHLDYIRYPETWKLKISRTQARAHITSIVQRIHRVVKARKPWVKMSCSPIGKYDDLRHYSSRGWNAYTKGCQDAQEWLRRGWMDAIFPMMYFKGNQFYPFALDWQENAAGRMVAAGLGVYMLSPREGNWDLEDIEREMSVSRQAGLGQAFFRSKFLTDNTKGIYDFTCRFNEYPALVPAMEWSETTAPSAPSYLRIKRGATADELEWFGAKDLSDAPYLLYHLYATTDEEVDITNAQQLVATRLMDNRIRVPHPENMVLNYAVTAANRYGQESKTAAYSESSRQRQVISKMPFLKNDGKHLRLPERPVVLDANYVTIETLQGAILSTVYWEPGRSIGIRTLPEGIYLLKSMGKKRVSHRLAYFVIRR